MDKHTVCEFHAPKETTLYPDIRGTDRCHVCALEGRAMNRHVDDGMQHGGLVPTPEEKEIERLKQSNKTRGDACDSLRRELQQAQERHEELLKMMQLEEPMALVHQFKRELDTANEERILAESNTTEMEKWGRRMEKQRNEALLGRWERGEGACPVCNVIEERAVKAEQQRDKARALVERLHNALNAYGPACDPLPWETKEKGE